MDPASIAKRTLEYQKTAIDAGYNTMVILQGHLEKMTAEMWEKSNLPKDSIKAFETTVNEYKKRRDDLKQMVDDSFDQLNKLFTS